MLLKIITCQLPSHSLFLSAVAELVKTARQLGSQVWVCPDQGTSPRESVEVASEYTEVTVCSAFGTSLGLHTRLVQHVGPRGEECS